MQHMMLVRKHISVQGHGAAMAALESCSRLVSCCKGCS